MYPERTVLKFHLVRQLQDRIEAVVFTRARRERLAYWKSIPLRRLGLLLVAAFCLFSSIGSLVSLLTPNQSLFSALIWAVFAGLVADSYVLCISRKPAWIPAVVLGQMVLNAAMNFGVLRLAHYWHPPQIPMETLVRVIGISTIVLTVTGYTCFLTFIQTEGRSAIRAQTELALAHGIQKTLVPVVSLETAACSVYGISVPSEQVGGDLVDCVPLADGSVVAYVVDVAGHGLQAGILMGMVKTAIRTRLLDQGSPPALFDRLNLVLPQVKEAHMYATCAALRIHPLDSYGKTRVEYALAGHPSILLCGSAGEPVETLSDEQFPVGLIKSASYRSQSFLAAAGDLLVVSTDGILEVAQKDGTEFGLEHLGALTLLNRTRPLAELCATILASVHNFGAQLDDQTLLVVRIA